MINQEKRKKITLSQWGFEWLEEKKKHLKESTYANYNYYIRHYIDPKLGNFLIDDINETILQEFLFYLISDGGKKTGLAVKTCRHIMSIVILLLKHAQKNGLIPNSDYSLYYPLKEYQELPVLSYHDENAICTAILSNMSLKKLGILLALYSGMRIGELCALKWGDIDLQKRSITIHTTIQRIYSDPKKSQKKTILQISAPKTEKSYREIPICNFLFPYLEHYKSDKNYFFLTASNNPIEPRNYRIFYKRFLTSINVPYIKFHALRHTFATKCVESGCDYKTLSTILGHASVHTTLDLYVHPRMEQKRNCIETMCNNSCINQLEILNK